MEMSFESSGSRHPDTVGETAHRRQPSAIVWLALSVLFLAVMGGIHLYLVFNGVGGVLGMLFVLNAIGALVLAIGIVVLRRRPQLQLVAVVLSVLFMAGTLLALVLALTVGLFGIHEVLSYQLVPATLIVESIGTIVLLVTTALLLQMRPEARGREGAASPVRRAHGVGQR